MVESGNTYGERVSRLVGWGHWFSFFNIVAAMLIGTRYITQSPWPETVLGQFYLSLSWIGHFGFLVFAIYLLVLFPLTFIVPSRKLFRLLAVCFATFGLTVLLVDTKTYQTLNLHLTPVVWELLFNDESTTFASDLNYLFILIPLIFGLELGLSEWVWHKQRRLAHKHVGRPLAAVFFLSFISSHLIYVWSDASLYTPVTSQKANFPLSYPMTAKSFMEKHGLFDRDEYRKRLEETHPDVSLVSYPLEPITYDRRANKLNVLVVSINNLRADELNPDVMPNTYAFAQKNLNFTNHYSSSNDSFGMFGLMYGLPSNYASSIRIQGTPPVLVSTLEAQKYQFGLFSADNFADSLYSETIFRGLPLNKTALDASTSPDIDTIDAWHNWVTEKASAPWFSYIELVGVQDFTLPSDSKQITSGEQIKQSYDRSVSAADNEVSRLLARLQQDELLNKTIVVITSNHGIEFNETQTNSWGSNSNYSEYQLKVPMIIHWPGKVATEFTHRTSHLDFSVTLLQDLLGVSSNPADYSSGRNLFNEAKRRWILAGDSRELALITDNQTTVVDKFGNFKIYDDNYKRLKETTPTLPELMQALTELQRFNNKDN